jgi:hypothetical protein
MSKRSAFYASAVTIHLECNANFITHNILFWFVKNRLLFPRFVLAIFMIRCNCSAKLPCQGEYSAKLLLDEAVNTSCRNINPYLLTWRIWWAPNNASRWQMGFDSAFKGLISATNAFNAVCFYLKGISYISCYNESHYWNQYVTRQHTKGWHRKVTGFIFSWIECTNLGKINIATVKFNLNVKMKKHKKISVQNAIIGIQFD